MPRTPPDMAAMATLQESTGSNVIFFLINARFILSRTTLIDKPQRPVGEWRTLVSTDSHRTDRAGIRMPLPGAHVLYRGTFVLPCTRRYAPICARPCSGRRRTPA